MYTARLLLGAAALLLSTSNCYSALFAVTNEDTIASIDSNTGQILNTIPTPVPTSNGRQLIGLAFDGTSLYFSSGKDEEPPVEPSTVFTLDPENGDVLNSFLLPSYDVFPLTLVGLGFGTGAFGPTLFGVNYGEPSYIVQLDPTSGELFSVNDWLFGYVTFGADFNARRGTLFVGTDGIQILEIDPITGDTLGNRGCINSDCLGPIGFEVGRMFVQAYDGEGVGFRSNQIVEVDLSTGEVLNTLVMPFGVLGLAGSPVPEPGSQLLMLGFVVALFVARCTGRLVHRQHPASSSE